MLWENGAILDLRTWVSSLKQHVELRPCFYSSVGLVFFYIHANLRDEDVYACLAFCLMYHVNDVF